MFFPQLKVLECLEFLPAVLAVWAWLLLLYLWFFDEFELFLLVRWCAIVPCKLAGFEFRRFQLKVRRTFNALEFDVALVCVAIYLVQDHLLFSYDLRSDFDTRITVERFKISLGKLVWHFILIHDFVLCWIIPKLIHKVMYSNSVFKL